MGLGCSGRAACAGSSRGAPPSPLVTSARILSWRFSGSNATKRLSSMLVAAMAAVVVAAAAAVAAAVVVAAAAVVVRAR